ncbi:MAG: cell division FtsA domain-containing protein [bacterium]
MLHTAVLPFGGDHFTNDVAIGLRTSLEVAEAIKLAEGHAVPDHVDRKEQFILADYGSSEDEVVKRRFIAEVIEARAEEIFEAVDHELRKIDRSGMLPVGAVLTGGSIKLEGLADVAKRVLRLPVTVGEIRGVSSVIDEVNDPAYATAVGLALWGFTIRASSGRRFPSLKIGNFSQAADQAKKWIKSLIP